MKFKIFFILTQLLFMVSSYSEEAKNASSNQDKSSMTSNEPAIPTNMLFQAHPWHGIPIGERAPEVVNCYVEIVPTDTVKYEVDKETGILILDRPQKYSSLSPTLYGFLPRTYAGTRTAKFTSEKSGRKDVIGDKDPLDVCILTEHPIAHGDLIVRAIPIGGFRILDGNEADDKIVAVLEDDFVFGALKDISECPEKLIDRLKHYFLTYKDVPEGNKNGQDIDKKPKIEILALYGREEAHEVIRRAYQDYCEYVGKCKDNQNTLK